jgi:hypothetical protein
LHDLHVADDAAFWDLEPIELTYLFDRWEASERRLDHRTAVLGCITANAWKSKDAQPIKPSDLFPSLAVDSDDAPVVNGETKEPVFIQAPDQQLMALKAIFGDRVNYREEV